MPIIRTTCFFPKAFASAIAGVLFAGSSFNESQAAGPWLYVTGRTSEAIVRFDLSTGVGTLVASLPGLIPKSIVVDKDGYIYITIQGDPRCVQRFTPSGAFDANVTPQIGTYGPAQLSLSHRGELVVGGGTTREVRVYDRTSGDLLDAFTPNGCCNVWGVTVDGTEVFVGEIFSRRITRFDISALPASTGTTVLSAGPEYLEDMYDLEIGHDGNIVAAGLNEGTPGLVHRFDRASGAHLGTLVDLTLFEPPATAAVSVHFDEELERYYICTGNADAVFELDTSGSLLRTFTHSDMQHTKAAWVSRIPPPGVCVGDIDGDGDTDVFDFGILATYFGQSVDPNTFGDLDGDGHVTVFDFGLFAPDFGCLP